MADTPLQAKLRVLMREHDISARAWSLKAGLSETAVKSVFQARSKSPRGETLSALAAALGVSVRELLPDPSDKSYTVQNRTEQATALTKAATDTHQHLRAWREHLGLTLEQAENKVPFNPGSVQGWETGAQAVDLDDLRILAEAYGVHPAALLFAPPGGPYFERLQSADTLLKDMDEEAAKLWFDMGKKLARPPS